MKRKGSKNKFLTCIRPAVDIDSMLEPPKTAAVDRSSSHRFLCIPSSGKHDENWISVAKSHPPKRKLAKNKRAQYSSKGSSFPDFSSSSSESSSSPSSMKKSMLRAVESSSMDSTKIKAHELNSPVPKSKDMSKHVNPKKKDQLEKHKTFRCIGVLLFLISLSITIIWGKFKGIVLTSMWLYFISLLVACFRRTTKRIITNQSIAEVGVGPK